MENLDLVNPGKGLKKDPEKKRNRRDSAKRVHVDLIDGDEHVLPLHGEVGQVRDSARVHGGCAEHIADGYVVNVDKLDKLPCAHVAELLDGGNAELLGVDVVLGSRCSYYVKHYEESSRWMAALWRIFQMDGNKF